MSRPEAAGHAAIFYNEKEARKYNSSSRMIGVQREITERAIELLRLPDCINDTSIVPSLILDIGCGSGLSGQVLEEKGHVWVGCDISRDMLLVAKERMNQQSQAVKDNRKTNNNKDSMSDDNDNDNNSDDDDTDDEFTTEANGDLLHHDMGTGLPFRSATFDACISISALQWLCYSNNKQQFPKKRLTRFFSSLYVVLKRGGRAVLQFYPETAEQAVLISEVATSCGFTGGVVVDYPNSAKAKKHYLVLSFDRAASQKKGLVDSNDIKQRKEQQQQQQQKQKQLHVASGGGSGFASAAASAAGSDSATKKHGKHKTVIRKKKGGIKTKEWILHKKDTERKRGKSVRPDTKYTARKRPTPF